MKYVICSIGHTAAGKTTTLKKISSKLGISFISEGTIKRSLVGESFGVNNSMDEELRSRGYRIAIDKAFEVLQTEDAVIIDASFHQAFRRKWVYETAKNNGLSDIIFVWVYCFCDDIDAVRERIDERARAKVVTADIQARSMQVYTYTMSTFDAVSMNDFPSEEKSLIIFNNTNKGMIEKLEFNMENKYAYIEEIVGAIYG